MIKGSIQVVQTAKVLAVIALAVSLFSTATVQFSSRQNCRDIQKQNKRIYDSQLPQLNRAKSGALDSQYKRIYGSQWQKIKQQQIHAAEALIGRFKPQECHLPIMRWTTN